MTNRANNVLYVGVTDDIQERVKEHKLKKYQNSFTAKYNCNKLVYFEEHDKSADALKREKQLKKWKRDWKINLLFDMKPGWADLNTNWNSCEGRNL